MSVNLLDFNISVGRKKPRTIPGMPNQSTCPFCDVQNLTGILATALIERHEALIGLVESFRDDLYRVEFIGEAKNG